METIRNGKRYTKTIFIAFKKSLKICVYSLLVENLTFNCENLKTFPLNMASD